ncbi:hypothetical protein DSECCO2_296490 [anaerobic digester metagenome]
MIRIEIFFSGQIQGTAEFYSTGLSGIGFEVPDHRILHGRSVAELEPHRCRQSQSVFRGSVGRGKRFHGFYRGYDEFSGFHFHFLYGFDLVGVGKGLSSQIQFAAQFHQSGLFRIVRLNIP